MTAARIWTIVAALTWLVCTAYAVSLWLPTGDDFGLSAQRPWR